MDLRDAIRPYGTNLHRTGVAQGCLTSEVASQRSLAVYFHFQGCTLFLTKPFLEIVKSILVPNKHLSL